MEKTVPLFRLDRDACRILRGVAILSVLLTHTHYISLLGLGGIVLFLILSGYGLQCSCEENGLRGYWKKRIEKVWLPYVLVGLFDVLAICRRDLRVILCTVIGLDLGLIADSTMWYISYIMLWYGAYYLSVLCTRRIGDAKIRAAVLLALLSVFSLIFVRLYHLGFWSAASGVSLYPAAFPLGVLLALVRKKRVSETQYSLFWLTLLFLSAGIMFRTYGRDMNAMMWTFTLLPVAIVHLVPPTGFLRRFLLWFGRYSYPIYLFEGLFLDRRKVWFSSMQIQPLIDLSFILVTAASAVVFWLSYKRFLQCLRRLPRRGEDREAPSTAASPDPPPGATAGGTPPTE